MKIDALGDRALIVKFSDVMSSEANILVRKMDIFLSNSKIEGITEWIPSYSSVTIIFDLLTADLKFVTEKIREFDESKYDLTLLPSKKIELPVAYGGIFGPDIEFVGKINGLSVDEIIKIHSSMTYTVQMIGFTPGFPYLYGMSEKIRAPRLEKPRKAVPEGSVGIAGTQTGIYPVNSPGGWRIIGRTPLKLFDPQKNPPLLFKIGDEIKFIPIDRKRYDLLCQK
uniref:5-oxoprolinase subunit PxpB n=1 Tax=Mesoaciditoga lauensis TaxID=1495039 RepID=A0A7V3VT57_9BACT